MIYTVKEIVQLILSAMDSDEVDNWNDTTESVQVANLLKSVYYDMAVELSLPSQDSFIEITASGDNTKPVLMTLPTTTMGVHWIEYNTKSDTDTQSDYKRLTYCDLDDFLEMQRGLANSGDSSLGQMSFTMNGETFEVLYRNDTHPTYYTHVNGTTLLFDSYDSTVDTTLQKSKTRVFAKIYPTFTLSNDFVPPLDPALFSLFINKAKVRAFNELKQQDNREAREETRHQKVVIQKRKHRVEQEPGIMKAPRYGKR